MSYGLDCFFIFAQIQYFMKKIYLLLSLFVFVAGFGQNFNSSDRDPSFNAFNTPLNNHFVDTDVTQSQVLSDGKIMVLKRQKEIVKLNGNLKDPGFTVGRFLDNQGSTAILQTFAEQTDGKILVGGNFKSYNGQIRYRLVRLNTDGSLDTSFNAPLGQLGSYGVLKIVLQPNGKIIIIGDTQPNSSSYYNNLARLNSDGTIDTSFVIPINYRFDNVLLQPDGKLIVNHNTNNDFYSDLNKLSRMNANGSLDTSFTTVTFSTYVGDIVDLRKLCLQTDGKILISGYFTGCSSVSRKDMVRLNADGTVDTSFTPGSGPTYSSPNYGFNRIWDIVVQPDNKILIAGNFTTFNGAARQKIARLNQDGTADLSFADVSTFLNIDAVRSISLFADGKILASGDLSQNKKNSNYIAKINPDGTRDTSYNNFEVGFFNSPVNAVLETPDGKILVGGDFHSYNGTRCVSFTRLNQDGTIDNTLTFGGLGGFDNANLSNITAIAQRPDGKIYLGGTFTQYNGVIARSIIRINTDGTLDTTFSAGTGFDFGYAYPGTINSIVVKPTGGILVTGTFGTYQGNNCVGVATISDSGSGFNYSNSTISYSVRAVKYQPDGKLLVGITGVKRYNAGTNTLDSSFTLDSTIAFNPTISTIELQTDGKVLIQGSFTIAGVEKSLIRLLSNGTIDPTFNFAGQSSTYKVANVTLTPDQKLLVFIYDSNTYINKVLRLNNDGSIDTSFTQQNYDYEEYYQSTPQFKITSNGKILVYGRLFSYQGKPARGLIRLMGENYFFIQGQNRLDANTNGCDASDALFPDLKYHVTDSSGLNNYDFIANTTGNYNIAMVAGNYTVTPVFENPTYFTASPSSIPVTFPSQTTPQLQNFCIIPVGNHPDLEVSVIPVNVARPGFDAKYKIIYKNKGNQIQSGTVNLAYDDSLMDLVSATPTASTQAANNLYWNFSNLNPLETREIVVTLNLNSPTDTPPLTADNLLSYTSEITSALTDEMPSDNTFILNQQVVNSYDPNDKTCLEGASIATTKVGDYVHYLIRFENTGSYLAENITVKDVIDTAKFDIATLEPTNGSHLFITKILNGNKVEFFFENINLPFEDNTNDGYVAFKIKTKSTLVLGDTFSNSAAIYFDYNYPIFTNTAVTAVQNPLGTTDVSFESYFVVYPNPASTILNIEKKADVEMKAISIYNTLGQLVLAIPNAYGIQHIDVSSLKTGNYIIKIKSDKGTINLKFLKK